MTGVKQTQALDDCQKCSVAELIFAVYVRTDATANRNFGMAGLHRQEESAPLPEPVDLLESSPGLDFENFSIAVKIEKPIEAPVLHAGK